MRKAQGVVVVSNRLPVSLRRSKTKDWAVVAGNGGLVTALTPVLRGRTSSWVGWTGIDAPVPGLEETLQEAGTRMGLRLCPILLTEEEVHGYYRGFSGSILWPLLHDQPTNCRFETTYWDYYAQVNRKFARVVADIASSGDAVWVHDYHLFTTASELRRLGARNPLGFFLHVPFPPPELFARLPWRRQILEGLLDFDVVGFQRDGDAENFLSCVRALVPDLAGKAETPSRPTSWPPQSAPDDRTSRGVTVGSFPISIDYKEFRSLAATPRVSQIVSTLQEHYQGQRVLLGVDRLDYTKGLPHKLRGYQRALERHPELRGRVALVQYVVPSRESVPGYRQLRPRIESLVGQINGRFGTAGWVPVRYYYRSVPREELCAHYRLATALLVTSLKDGMNLVSKEYCACNLAGDGVLVLSEFAGAASQLGHDAVLVNPHDADAVAHGIHTALTMPRPDRIRRMGSLSQSVERDDVHRWVNDFFETLLDEEIPWDGSPHGEDRRPHALWNQPHYLEDRTGALALGADERRREGPPAVTPTLRRGASGRRGLGR